MIVRVLHEMCVCFLRILALKAGMILDDSEGNTDKLEELCLEMAANTERLTQLGRHEEAVQTMLDHTRIIRRSASLSVKHHT